MIPELLADSGQPLWLAADRFNPEVLAFTTKRPDRDLEEFWEIMPIGDIGEGFYQISNNGSPQGEAFALGVVDDGVYDQVVMSGIGEFGGTGDISSLGDISGYKWRFTHLENGYCRLTTEFLGLEMALTVVNYTPSLRLAIAPVSNDPGQHWRLEFFASYGMLTDSRLRMCGD